MDLTGHQAQAPSHMAACSIYGRASAKPMLATHTDSLYAVALRSLNHTYLIAAVAVDLCCSHHWLTAHSPSLPARMDPSGDGDLMGVTESCVKPTS